MSIRFTLNLNDTTHYKLVELLLEHVLASVLVGQLPYFGERKKNPIMPTGPTTSHPLTSVNETCGPSRALTSLL